ncbi:hypothetical protein Deipe_4076 (plasmid) [Deinococcus peraridilitoris DSM 19664]|uniref:Uncharacterized protein n=1 Tax=Deinococcus peraridilitoris (strain DSM 19664 / LMG 22246 / CIP 109416 / KR-200) TaxID=937777 RepID=L0A8F0_DEIPD|nr:hypothetical protein Deipe_4076 [Deinococcus peraridilitoris DSM 19664]
MWARVRGTRNTRHSEAYLLEAPVRSLPWWSVRHPEHLREQRLVHGPAIGEQHQVMRVSQSLPGTQQQPPSEVFVPLTKLALHEKPTPGLNHSRFPQLLILAFSEAVALIGLPCAELEVSGLLVMNALGVNPGQDCQTTDSRAAQFGQLRGGLQGIPGAQVLHSAYQLVFGSPSVPQGCAFSFTRPLCMLSRVEACSACHDLPSRQA